VDGVSGANKFVTRLPMRDLLAVANVLVLLHVDFQFEPRICIQFVPIDM